VKILNPLTILIYFCSNKHVELGPLLVCSGYCPSSQVCCINKPGRPPSAGLSWA